MAKRDYYEALGVTRSASGPEIKKAFRTLAMKYHPDRNPNDASAEQSFKEINEAYEVLKDEQKRAAYDQFGHAAFEQAGGAGARGGFDFHDFSSMFDDLFGDVMGGRRRGTGLRGADLRYNLEITLEEAFSGKSETIRVPTTTGCSVCSGSGSADGAAPVACPTCRGAGRVRSQQGFFTVERTCPSCQGAGRVISDPCPSCNGSGRVQQDKSLEVSIPAGVEDGTRIRLTGEGEAGMRGGAPGDLYIFISVAPHRLFMREGGQIGCRVPIPMTTAALGGSIEVPTIEGTRARIQVPAGTQNGHQFRLRGKGMTELHGGARRGDMLVEIVVEIPVKLTRKQEEILRSFASEGEINGSSHHPASEGFFAKVKDFWDDLSRQG
ncbi:molecular chaperone DnaJ [Marinivivus vitaminiproducens]|uniref:molecular chaperone DnaJ n=1 Tax=Marinivivus vitaminiproducens TaxID=3035935 RepID=UPI00279B5155|nr:molecular chaperone DnaJ [Geminicoccaceae bacterium SCSIO 64248]